MWDTVSAIDDSRFDEMVRAKRGIDVDHHFPSVSMEDLDKLTD